jgi:MFS family permease
MVDKRLFTRDFILIGSAQFVFSAVFCLLMPTLPIYLSRKGATESQIGILIGVFSVASLLLRPFVGKALGRIPERRFLFAGTVLYLAASLAYLVAMPFWPIMVVRILHGIGLAFFATASITLTANMAADENRGQALSYFFVTINVAFAVAPFSGMLLINHFGFTWLFIVCAMLSLVSLLIVGRLPKVQEILPAGAAAGAQPFVSWEAMPPSIMAFLVNIIWGALTAFFPLYALSRGIQNPGYFFGTVALVHVFARGFGGRVLDLYEREKIILPCLFVYILAMILMTFATTLPLCILVGLVYGGGNAFLYPTLVAFALDRAGTARGPAMGTFTAVADLGAGMGSVIMGAVLEMTGYRTMFVCLVGIAVCNLAYFHFMVKTRAPRRDPAAPEGQGPSSRLRVQEEGETHG